ncbi:MAG TPA: hypothetical protein VME18_04755 [Acidobacteriaceae bacterium]|nr:hypothetical protein [Acidobacteriaceae bacterium]
MNDDRKSILELLAAGKITAEEAERLLAALEARRDSSPANSAVEDPTPAEGSAAGRAQVPAKGRAKYLRVLVEADEHSTGLKGGPTTVNVRVPMQLLRAGVRLAGLIPAQAHEQLDQAFSKHGVPITLSQIKPENLEELIDHLADLTVDVDGKDENKTRVRVFCE